MHQTHSRHFLTLHVRLGIVSLLIPIAVAMIILYYFNPQARDVLNYTATVILAVAGILSAFYVAESLQLQADRDKMRASYDLIMQIDDPTLLKARIKLDSFMATKDDITPADFYKKIQEDPELNLAVKKMLNLFESISSGIKFDYISEDIAHRDLSILLPYYVEKLRPYIEAARIHYRNNQVFSDCESLHDRWKPNHYKKLIDNSKDNENGV